MSIKSNKRNHHEARSISPRGRRLRILRLGFRCACVLTATANLRASCGKYTAGTAAAQAGVNIVNNIWKRNGEICRYATRQFKGDVERALLNEFPDNCMQGQRRCKCVCRWSTSVSSLTLPLTFCTVRRQRIGPQSWRKLHEPNHQRLLPASSPSNTVSMIASTFRFAFLLIST